MKIKLTSVIVDDQEKALHFYTEKMGFVLKRDLPAGSARWLTVVSPEDPDGVELLLEPNGNPASLAFQKSIYEQRIPATMFYVDNVQQEYERMTRLGVVFPTPPATADFGTFAVLDDTCGNLIQIFQG